VLATVLPTTFPRLHPVVEGMGPHHHAVTDQHVSLRPEGTGDGPSSQAAQLHRRTRLDCAQWLVIAIGIEPVLGRYSTFENGHFEGEIPIAQQSAAVGTALVIAAGGGAIVVVVIGGRAAGRQQQGEKDETGETWDHGVVTPEIAVRRSMSIKRA